MKISKYRCILLFLIGCMVTTVNASMSLNGSANYKDLGKNIFISSLYLENPSQSAELILDGNEEMKLQVTMIDRMSKRRWVNMWMQSIAINNPRADFEAQANNLVDLFDNIKGALIADDIVEIIYVPGQGTTFSLNSVPLMHNESKDLLILFLRAWVGSVPPSTQFKSLILGKGDSSSIAALAAGIKPSAARITAVTQWTISEEEKLVEEQRLKEEQQRKEEAAKQKEQEAQLAKTTAKAKAEEEAAKARAEAVAAEAKLAENQAARIKEEQEKEDIVELSVESILAQQEYTTQAVRKIYKNIRYPRSSVKRNQQGTVRVNVIIQRSGELVSAEVAESSTYKLLDKAALKAISKAAPFDPVPEIITEAPQQLLLPISFRLSD